MSVALPGVLTHVRLRAIAALLVGALSQAYAAEPAPAPEPEKVDATQPIQSAPVMLDGVSLFRVSGSTSFSGEERAAAVSGRIADLARNERVRPEDVTFVPRETRVDIVADESHIVSAVESDALLEGIPAVDVAEMRVMRIRQGIVRYRSDRTPEYLVRASGYAALATVAAVLALWLTLRTFRFALNWLERRFVKHVHDVRIHSFEILRADTLWRTVRGVVQLLRIAVVAILIYLYLPFALRQFPWTRGLATRLIELVVDPLRAIGTAIVGYLPKLVFLIILVLIVRYILKLTRLFFDAISTGSVTLPNFDQEWAAPTHNIVRVLIVLLAVVVAFPYIPGSGSAAFQGLSLFAGLVFSLGASSVMANLIAGYTVTYRRAFRIGDRITIGEHTGEVTAIRLLVTHLRTPKNEEVIVPNSVVLQSQVVNYSKMAQTDGLILHTSVGIGYETPWRQVEAMLLLAAQRTSGVLREPPPFILVKSLGDFAVTYDLNAYVNSAAGVLMRYAELHRNILDVFNEHRVQIMTPAYEGDPEQPKIVPKEQWFIAPARASEDTTPEMRAAGQNST